MSTAEPSKSKGRGHTKVRTGCVSCKIRRVKCDETKPACQRCTSTGRVCDGYVPAQKRRWFGKAQPDTLPILAARADNDPPSRQLFDSHCSVQEKRCLEYFQLSAAADLSGDFETLFWDRLILQLYHAEPCIRYAVTALSSLHREHVEGSATRPLHASADNKLALGSYIMAVVSLSTALDNGSSSVTTPLATCLLLTCFEFLRRDIDAAMRHIHSGCAILRARSECLSAECDTFTGRPFKHALPQDPYESTLISTFERLCILSGLFFRPAPTPKLYEKGGDYKTIALPPFSSFEEARDLLMARIAPALDFVRITGEVKYDPVAAARYKSKQRTLLADLDHWNNRFEQWLSSSKDSTQHSTLAPELLRLQHDSARIWASTCLSATQTIYDQYTSQFANLISLATRLQRWRAESSQRRSCFSFEMVTIPTLFMIGVKCRNQVLRRQAIDLLLREPRREGLWDSYRAGKVAERLMILEEQEDCNKPVFNANVTRFMTYTTEEFPELNLCGEAKTQHQCLNLFAKGPVNLDGSFDYAQLTSAHQAKATPGFITAEDSCVVSPALPDERNRIHDYRIAHDAAIKKDSSLPITFKWKPQGMIGPWLVCGEILNLQVI